MLSEISSLILRSRPFLHQVSQPHAIALYDFEGQDVGDLSFKVCLSQITFPQIIDKEDGLLDCPDADYRLPPSLAAK